MSGFVALVNLDGSPADERLLLRMTRFLEFRGPDRQESHLDGQAGLGHTLLRVGEESDRERQPLTLDGRHWIVADARIDARHDLIDKLSDGSIDSRTSPPTDVELIARAYAKWGDGCVSHLLGDFAFAIWDAPRRRLFCARDHFGIKPLFYLRVGATVAVSNALDCLRLHPGISNDLNEQAVADFLLFGENREADTTIFGDIKRVPPAHHASWFADGTRIQRYWTLPIDEPIQLARNGDYVDRFNELLGEAVSDRLRTDRVTVLMSGGVDSPALAATALERRDTCPGLVVDAVTSVYERLIPDPERCFAGLVASHLKIPIRYDVRDDEPSIADWDRVSVSTPEPVANPPAFAAAVKFLRTTARGARVFFYGEGPDNALRYEWRPYLSHLVRTRQPGRVFRSLCDDAWMHPRVPLWSSIRQLATARSRSQRWQERFPDWLDDSFATRYQCRERWVEQQLRAPALHPVRPLGYAGLDGVRWQSLFEDCDITAARGHIEFRYPFLDIRLVRFLLALPAMPWCRNKLILRRAMATKLPRRVLARRKTVVPTSADFRRMHAAGLPRPSRTPELLNFVSLARLPAAVESEQEMRAALRPLGLGYWLERYTTVDSKESPHGVESAFA